MRESTKATRATILQSAKEIFLECGYQETSMRKIAARAGITPGAIYKHFSGKEEMFGEIFAESGNKLMALSESMLDIDFSAMSDEQLMQVFYSRISILDPRAVRGRYAALPHAVKKRFRHLYPELPQSLYSAMQRIRNALLS